MIDRYVSGLALAFCVWSLVQSLACLCVGIWFGRNAHRLRGRHVADDDAASV